MSLSLKGVSADGGRQFLLSFCLIKKKRIWYKGKLNVLGTLDLSTMADEEMTLPMVYMKEEQNIYHSDKSTGSPPLKVSQEIMLYKYLKCFGVGTRLSQLIVVNSRPSISNLLT